MPALTHSFFTTGILALSLDSIVLLKQEFLHNPIRDWCIALILVLVAIIVARTIYWFIEKHVKKLTEKTATKLDDLLIEMIKKPLVFASALGGAWVGLNYLDFSSYGGVDQWINGFFSVLITLLGAWLLCRLFDAVLDEYAVPFFEDSETDLDDILVPIVRRGVKTIVWIVATIMAMDNAGVRHNHRLGRFGRGRYGLCFGGQGFVGQHVRRFHHFHRQALWAERPHKGCGFRWNRERDRAPQHPLADAGRAHRNHPEFRDLRHCGRERLLRAIAKGGAKFGADLRYGRVQGQALHGSAS